METQQANFEGWAIVEMLGHQREIGYVTTQAFGQAVLFRVDTPELQEREFILPRPEYVTVDGGRQWCVAGSKVKRSGSPARSRLVSPSALYALNPCTEEAAREALEHASPRPLILIEAPARAAIEAAIVEDFNCCDGNSFVGHTAECMESSLDDDDENDDDRDEVPY